MKIFNLALSTEIYFSPLTLIVVKLYVLQNYSFFAGLHCTMSKFNSLFLTKTNKNGTAASCDDGVSYKFNRNRIINEELKK